MSNFVTVCMRSKRGVTYFVYFDKDKKEPQHVIVTVKKEKRVTGGWRIVYEERFTTKEIADRLREEYGVEAIVD